MMGLKVGKTKQRSVCGSTNIELQNSKTICEIRGKLLLKLGNAEIILNHAVVTKPVLEFRFLSFITALCIFI
jgi:hypothetical protein